MHFRRIKTNFFTVTATQSGMRNHDFDFSARETEASGNERSGKGDTVGQAGLELKAFTHDTL